MRHATDAGYFRGIFLGRLGGTTARRQQHPPKRTVPSGRCFVRLRTSLAHASGWPAGVAINALTDVQPHAASRLAVFCAISPKDRLSPCSQFRKSHKLGHPCPFLLSKMESCRVLTPE
jgi:hypothetical protein